MKILKILNDRKIRKNEERRRSNKPKTNIKFNLAKENKYLPFQIKKEKTKSSSKNIIIVI